MNRRPRRIATLYLAAVFAAGAGFGVAAYRFYAVNIAKADFQPAPLSPQEFRAQAVSKLQRELNLTSEQTVELQKIYDYVGERFHDVRDAMETEFEAMRKERADRILGILTPEQQEKYRAILEEKRRKREAAKASGSCY
jgi:Spy/CpxP family protein refolding chaperone